MGKVRAAEVHGPGKLRPSHALPELAGRWSRPVAIVWLALLAFALIGTTFGTWAIGSFMLKSDLVWAELGLRSSPGERERIVEHPLGPAARRAGIAPNSSLLSVNGVGVTIRNAEEVLRSAGRSPVLRLAGPGETARELRLHRDPRNALAEDPSLPVGYASFRNIALASSFAINIAFLVVAGTDVDDEDQSQSQAT